MGVKYPCPPIRKSEKMASITIDNLDERLQDHLREQADRHGRSMEEEALLILQKEIPQQDAARQVSSKSLAQEIHDLFADVGGVELELPPREPAGEPPRFE